MGKVMRVVYPELAAEIAKRGVRKKDIAKCVRISDRALSNKLQGRTAFTWDEVSKIRDTFFPDVQKDTLFKVADGERRGDQMRKDRKTPRRGGVGEEDG